MNRSMLLRGVLATAALGGVVLGVAGPASAADGVLDSTFGTGGKVVTDISPNGGAGAAIVTQSDGKLVVVGSTGFPTQDFLVIRYNANGTLDTTFDSDGIVTTDFGSDDAALAVVLQPTGEIVVAGISNNDFAVARYTSTGALDTTFDTDGKLTTDMFAVDRATGVALQSTGEIVVAGTSNDNFAVARYTSAGALDTTFDTDGRALTDFGDTETASGVAVQSTGEIVVVGTTGNYPNGDFAVARYTSAGALDTSFDTDGKLTTDFGTNNDTAQAVVIDGSGNILVAGTSSTLVTKGFALARYTSSGALDTTFDTDGKVVTTFGADDQGTSLALTSTGKIVVAGYSNTGSDDDFTVARLTSSGAMDTTFGTNGAVYVDFGPGTYDFAYGVTIQAVTGKIVAAGQKMGTPNTSVALVRFGSTGALPPTGFGGRGVNTSLVGLVLLAAGAAVLVVSKRSLGRRAA